MNSTSNFDLLEIANKMKLPLKGVYFKDNLPEKIEDGYYIINLQSKNDPRNGTHWTVFYYDNLNNLYYDSFGFPAPKELEIRLTPYTYNDRDIQNINSSSCGFYCIAFIKFLHNFEDKEKAFNIFLDMFDDNTAKNELILHDILYKNHLFSRR